MGSMWVKMSAESFGSLFCCYFSLPYSNEKNTWIEDVFPIELGIFHSYDNSTKGNEGVNGSDRK